MSIRRTVYSPARQSWESGAFFGLWRDGEGPAGFLPSLCNLWGERDGTLRTAPGTRLWHRFSGTVRGLAPRGQEEVLVHAGTSLYRLPLSLRDRPRETAAQTPVLSLRDAPSAFAAVGEETYLCDGQTLCRVTADGAQALTGENVYVPTTYRNRERYEDANLLTDRQKEVFTVYDTAAYAGETGGLRYTSLGGGEVAVSASEQTRSAAVIHVPPTVRLGEREYAVTRVAARGFADCTALVRVRLPEGIRAVGDRAFSGCTALTEVTLPDTAETLGYGTFYGCTSLTALHLGLGLKESGAMTLYLCPVQTLTYPGDEEKKKYIYAPGEHNLLREGLTWTMQTAQGEDLSAVYRFPLYAPGEQVLSVTLDGQAVTTTARSLFGTTVSYSLRASGAAYSDVTLAMADGSALSGRTVEILYRAAGGDVQPGKAERLACQGGRLFLQVGDKVYYSGLDAAGRLRGDYLPATACFPVKLPLSLLAPLGDCVLLGEGDALRIRRATATGEDFCPVIYPVAEEVTGLPRPLSLLSHPYGVTLLTEGGVYGVATLSTGRHTFTPLSTALAPLSFAGGMLGRAGERVCVLLPDGALYAADPAMPVSLSGHSEYRWFPLSPIGGYREDALLYRYAAALPPGVTGLTLSPTPGRAVTETVYSAAAPDGTVCYYVRDGAQRIAVDADGERQGGVFTPAAFLCDIAGLLLFATPDGALGLLSTDRPGQAMYLETQSELYIPGETADDFRPLSAPVPLALHAAGEVQTLPLYRLQDGAYTPAGEGPVYRDGDFAVLCALLHAGTEDMLPPEDSHRCGHAFAVAAVFPTLGRDTPGMLKATEPGSTVLRTRVLAPAAVTVSVRTDRTPFRPCGRAVTAAADFTGTDFAAFAFATDRHRQIVCREAERGWREKQLAVSSQGFRAPFALVGLSTRYHVTGPCR